MAYGTVIQQGRFTQGATATNKIISVRSDFDWFEVINFTNSSVVATNGSTSFFWQRGMASGTAFRYFKNGGAGNLNLGFAASPTGINIINSSNLTLGTPKPLTALTAANPPVITALAADLPTLGSTVIFDNLDNQSQIARLPLTVSAVNAGAPSFTIGNINLTNSTASTAGFFRVIPFDPIYSPRRRFITYVETNSTTPKIYLSATHNFQRGEIVRLYFPGGSSVWGSYAALDGLTATVQAVNSARAGNEPNNALGPNNIVLNVDTTGFTAWNANFGAANNEAYPADNVSFTPAQVVPIGEDVGYARSNNLNELVDATRNTAFIGVELPAGANSPGGEANNVIYWRAGKSELVTNE